MNQFNQFVESLSRLYASGKITTNKIVELFESKKITEDEKRYILNAH